MSRKKAKNKISSQITEQEKEPVQETIDPILKDEIVTESNSIKKDKVKVTHFLDPQSVSASQKDFMAVFDEDGRIYNKMNHFIAGCYRHRWKGRKIVNTGRQGVWAVMPKDHPEFKGKVFVNRDDSPNENYFSYEDLVLCVARKETMDSERNRLNDLNRQILEGNKEDVRQGIERIVKETKPGAVSQIKPIG